jgi:hypothetical protein
MNLKEFFKPTKGKIVIVFLLITIAYASLEGIALKKVIMCEPGIDCPLPEQPLAYKIAEPVSYALAFPMRMQWTLSLERKGLMPPNIFRNPPIRFLFTLVLEFLPTILYPYMVVCILCWIPEKYQRIAR